jgi:hypothetical protein
MVPAPIQDKALGTGHGRSETSVVRWTNFERASQTPDEVIAIHYDSYRNLLAQGVINEQPRIARPSPFRASSSRTRASTTPLVSSYAGLSNYCPVAGTRMFAHTGNPKCRGST